MKQLLISLFLMRMLIASAQSLKDTLHLDEVIVSATLFELKNHHFTTGKKIQYADSMLKQIYSLNNLSDILNYQSSIFVKNYAPGSIATTSVRGGNSQQTMILWNGININHPMLGQADLSQPATGLFDDLSVEYGAASSLWGSPAMNGAIRLENTFSNKRLIELKYRFGSFNTHSFLGRAKLSHKKANFYIHQYNQISQNNYTIGDSLQVKNASFFNSGIIGGIQYRVNNKCQIQIHSWVNFNNRNIPNNYFFNQYAAKQKDENFRNVADLTYAGRRIKFAIKTAYLIDKLNYRDSVARINSKSKVHSFQTEQSIYKKIFSETTEWVFGHQWVWNYAITNNYLNNAVVTRHSVYTGIKQNIKKFNYSILVRKEWANIQSTIPFTGNIGAEYKIFPFLTLKIQGAKNYRLPTMNDLYWKNSGNISLKPESGYEYESGIVIKLNIPKWNSLLVSEMTLFNRYTNNWIIWLPGGNGNPVPANISKVWSRGTETNNYWMFMYRKLQIKLATSSAYILSTIEESKINNDASVGKQLIYTPRYNINGYLQIIFKSYFLLFNHQYIGYRFIASDNLQWLDPYHVSNISFGKNIFFKNIKTEIFLGVNNLFDTPYMIISQRPMPGRNYFIQINININPKNQPL